MSPAAMTKRMCHEAGQGHLHQDIYTAKRDPELYEQRRDSQIGGHGAELRAAVTNLYQVPTRPSAASIDDLGRKVITVLEVVFSHSDAPRATR